MESEVKRNGVIGNGERWVSKGEGWQRGGIERKEEGGPKKKKNKLEGREGTGNKRRKDWVESEGEESRMGSKRKGEKRGGNCNKGNIGAVGFSRKTRRVGN